MLHASSSSNWATSNIASRKCGLRFAPPDDSGHNPVVVQFPVQLVERKNGSLRAHVGSFTGSGAEPPHFARGGNKVLALPNPLERQVIPRWQPWNSPSLQ